MFVLEEARELFQAFNALFGVGNAPGSALAPAALWAAHRLTLRIL
jgi:hypothetical protein